jgi:hypothetical protein
MTGSTSSMTTNKLTLMLNKYNFANYLNHLNRCCKSGLQVTLLISGLACLYACNGQPVDQVPALNWPKDADVYIAGDESQVATYWKNGLSVHLTKQNEFSHAAAIAVDDNGVYVSGNKSVDKNSVDSQVGSSPKNSVVDSVGTSLSPKGTFAGYWKNGSFIKLTNGTVNADGSAIVISGSDVYVAGFECNGQNADSGSDDPQKAVAKYWKNATPVALTDGSNVAKATAIAVDANNVYVVGYEELGPNHLKEARYWKNGRRVDLKIDKHLTHGSDFSEANSIFVMGKDVYIAGTESGLATYWKNGDPVKLVNREKYQRGQVEDMTISTATSIIVSGKDVYVGGTQDTLASKNTIAKYWKNGVALSLTHSPEDLKSDVLIGLSGKEAYLTYSIVDRSDKRLAKIWGNGRALILSYGLTVVHALLIVKHPQ